MNVSKAARNKLFLALDVKELPVAQRLIEQLSPYVGMIKVGMRLIYRYDTEAMVKLVNDAGTEAFIDVKPYDIGNTVGDGVDALAESGAAAITIHIENGYHNLVDALEACKRSIKAPYPRLFGVTVLTDKSKEDLEELGIHIPEGQTVTYQVLRLARIAQLAGLQGLIASPQELVALRNELAFKDMKIWTPGVRPTWAPSNDQKRTLTPYEAICAGADAVIVGRPILQPPKGMTPVDAALKILEEIERALDTSPQDPGPMAA